MYTGYLSLVFAEYLLFSKSEAGTPRRQRATLSIGPGVKLISSGGVVGPRRAAGRLRGPMERHGRAASAPNGKSGTSESQLSGGIDGVRRHPTRQIGRAH